MRKVAEAGAKPDLCSKVEQCRQASSLMQIANVERRFQLITRGKRVRRIKLGGDRYKADCLKYF